MIQITIDDQTYEVPEKVTVLQATRLAGIDIPTLCDHPSLKPYGGCRLCVVEVEGIRTLQASCTLPVYNGMVVHTNTPKVHKARDFVLTLLFSERNHFCPFCQKTGGDCELQNAAYGEDMTHWPIQPNWKPYALDSSHPYIIIDHNRCILCRRCVRACGELVGNYTLSIENRGANSLLVADYDVPFGESSCVRCGTCLQICPTGALISKQSAYLGLESDAEHVESICVGCSVGCGVDLVVRDNHLLRIDGNWDAPVNGGVLCEKGRFLPMQEKRQRVCTPLVRRDGKLQPASWSEALEIVAARFAPLKGQTSNGIAALASTRLNSEALFAFKDLFANHLQSEMVTGVEEDVTFDRRLDGKPQAAGLEALKQADCVLVVGADLEKSHPVAGFFVKRNLVENTRLIVIDPNPQVMANLANYHVQPKPGSDAVLLQGIMAGIAQLGLDQRANPEPPAVSIERASRESGVAIEALAALSRIIGGAQKVVIVAGKGITSQADSAASQALSELADQIGARALINVKGKANSFAAALYELDRPFDTKGHAAAYLALGDDYPSQRLEQQIAGIPFLAVQASYVSTLTEKADVVLPVGIWSEEGGHYMNMDGRLQAAQQALEAPDGVWSNLMVLQTLAGQLGAPTRNTWKEALYHSFPATETMQI
jgi:predicted molibdopterin-dependent oxidoreductase YjgC